MSTSSTDSIFSLGTTRMSVAVGATLALLCDFGSNPGCNSVLLKYFSGGTCEILGVTTGVTLTAAQLATASGTGYLLDTTEKLSLDGPARFYLSNLSATTIIHCIFGRSAGQ